MGFRTARSAAPLSKILLIASLEAKAIESQADRLDGVHAALIRFSGAALTAKLTQTITSSLPDIPWGFYLEDDVGKKMETLAKAGADFVVFPAASPVSITPGDDKTGRVLQVESSMDDGLLRAVNNMPVDAVLVADAYEDGGSLVWHELMIYQHLSNIINKPLIVPVPVSLAEVELKALWEAGVDGVLIEPADAGADGLKTLRKAIDNLPPRSARKRGKAEALLPRLPGEAPPDEEEDE